MRRPHRLMDSVNATTSRYRCRSISGVRMRPSPCRSSFSWFFSPPNGRYVLYPRWSCNCRPCSSVRSASSVVRSVFVGFLTVIIAGLFGDQNPMRNLAPVAVGWVGFSFLSAVLGPVWRVLNPWATLYRCSRWMRSRLARRKGERRRVAPTWLGVWPAFVLLIIFAWMELVWSGRDIPADLATALIVYSVMTWAGMS